MKPKKVSISYPPLESGKGTPLLGQNRQFQWFTSPTFIYPMVPAYAATMLDQAGFDVFWDDAIAEGLTYRGWLERVVKERPDVIAIETKTPVVKSHWKIISDIKEMATPGWSPKIVLVGDHVTALPEESMRESPVDFVLTGGDYDFLLVNLCKSLNRVGRGSEGLEKGVWYRDGNDIKSTGPYELDHDLGKLPAIDRALTRWELYSELNGNYKLLPGTYTMAARDCWWGRCSFCSWTTIYPGSHYRSQPPGKVVDEIGEVVERFGVREVMDDSGTFPVGDWLAEFCALMVKTGLNRRVRVDCNMRFGVLKEAHYRMMREAGFRFVLFGLESANQNTLDRIGKKLAVTDIVEGARMAKEAGLAPHVTVMIGYPWETKDDAGKTVELARRLFRCGWIDTLQATIVIPYPGTPLFRECSERGWLLTEDWDRYDMREPVMKTPMTGEDIKGLTRSVYRSFASPQYIFKKLVSIRSLDDIRFLKRAGRKLIGHLMDFSLRKEASRT